MKFKFLLFALLTFAQLAVSQTTVGDIIRDSPDHTVLEIALDTTGLFAALDDTAASLTVFAPVDDAFAAIDPAVIAQLLENVDNALTDILTFHVVGSEVLAETLTDGASAPSLNGKALNFTIAGTDAFVENALITVTNLQADNGVVHVINAVLLPSRTSILDIITNSDDHSTLETAVGLANLNGTLAGSGEFTVFAPTDAAFAALPAGALDALIADTTGQLRDILLYHAVAGSVRAEDIGVELLFPTLQGTTAAAYTDGTGAVFVDGVQVTVANLEADNGIVHVIDARPINPDLRYITDIVVESPAHDTLEQLLGSLGLNATLSTTDVEFTLFAPTDAAFAALGSDVIAQVLADPALLNAILSNHLVTGTTLAADLSDGDVLRAITNRRLNIEIDNGVVTINGAVISMTDLTADNGVVHVVDAVVPTAAFTILDVVDLNPQSFSTLAAALDASGLDAAVDDPDAELTVFAPTDAAFDVLGQDVLDALLADPSGDLTTILQYHVLGEQVGAVDLSNGDKLTTLMGDDLNVTLIGNPVRGFVENAELIQVDVVTDNGVIHVVDVVLNPARVTVNEIVEGSDDHETLEVAIGAAGLNGVLSIDGNYTLFAPTDAAFAALPAGTIDALLADPTGDLTDVLFYHLIADQEVASADLEKGMMVETTGGETAFIEITADNRVFIDNAEIVMADLQAANGIVHVIDAVLLPGRETVVDVVIGSDDHTTLETVLSLARLTGTLSGDGPFTVFAPTDAAFANVDPATVAALTADPDGALTTVLTYHVVAGAITSDMLTSGLVPTLQGESIDVVVDNGVVTVNGAAVTTADIAVDNGVVHVIDGVLLPPSITSVAEVAYVTTNVFPNPASDFITVEFDEVVSDMRYAVIGMDGRTLLQGVLLDNQIMINDLPTGKYTVAFNGAELNYVSSFIKIK